MLLRSMLLLTLILAGTLADAQIGRSMASRILRQDLRNHALVRPKPLAAPRTVYRYTSRPQASRELSRGLAPNTHMTANARVGRPLSARAAQPRYGLLHKPQVRETIRLPKGTALRHNRATNAERGIGELTSPKRVPKGTIRRVVPLKP